MNTTGATLIVVEQTDYIGGFTPPAVTDNQGNTYLLAVTATQTANNCTVRIFYCAAPVTSASHTFTVSSSNNTSFVVQAWNSGTTTAFLDRFSAGTNAAQAGSITPTYDGEMIFAACMHTYSSTGTIDSGFTIAGADFIPYLGGSYVGSGAAYLIQTTAAAVNPTWNVAGQNIASAIASFTTTPPPGRGYRSKPPRPQLQRGHPLARNIIAAWPFYENTGQTLNNIADPRGTTTAWHADSPTSFPTWKSSPFGACLDVDRIGTHMSVQLPEWFSTLSPPFTLYATATNVSGSVTSRYQGLIILRGYNTAMGLHMGNSNNCLAGEWNSTASEYDALTGMRPPVGIPFSAAMVITPSLFTIFYYDPTSGFQTFTLAETCSTINLSGGVYVPLNWVIGSDGYDSNARVWPGTIHNIMMAQYAASSAEFMVYAFDPFAIYRPRSRLWESVQTGPPLVITPGINTVVNVA
jgi:hypothetical protein